MRASFVVIGIALSAAAGGGVFAACGGSTNNNVGDDASTEGGADVGTPEGNRGDSGDAGNPSDTGGGDADAGASCAPPANASQGAVCVTLTPETIQFLANDPRFDGKGVLVVALYSVATPPNDGGDVVGTPVLLPPQDGGSFDGGFAQLDLSQPVPVVRFDGVPPGTVYARAIFIDDVSKPPTDVGPGWWLGGYDFSGGILAAPLFPVTVTAGAGTSVAMDLRAVRGLGLNVTTSVQPLGNGQGPFQMIIVDRPNIGPDAGDLVFGVGNTPCANVLADGGATVIGLFIGGGPLWILPDLNDFGLPGNFPPGTMTAVDFDGGGVSIPQSSEIEAGTSYVVLRPLVLNYVALGDAGVDMVMCP
jgi:hypothetical protein